MNHLFNTCFICLKDIDKFQTVYLNRTEDAVKQIKYVLPEIALEPEIPVHICSTCHTKLHSFCTFKKQCLENYFHLTKKLRESGNAKNQTFNAIQTEIKNIKEEHQVDVDLANEALEDLNSQINFITKKDTIETVQDEIFTPELNKNINQVAGMTYDNKSYGSEEQHNQTNNLIQDNIYIKEDIIQFEDSEQPNVYQELLSDIKKEIDNEQDINEIGSNNSERTVNNLIISSDLNQKVNESNIQEQIKSVELKICNKKFTQRSDFNSHIKDYQCVLCEKKFTHNTSLIRHMKTHTGAKNIQCSVCDKKFTYRTNLNLHMKTHTGVKDFQCPICDKKFIRNNNMKQHMKIHNGNEFQCPICNLKYAQSNSLKRHMKSHSGVRDFQCSVCEKQFIRNCDMKLHMKTHTGVKDIQCLFCEKKFMRRSNMRLHMKIHTRVKDFQCSICKRNFVRNNSLKLHMKTHIPDVLVL